jgi:hypothetical protein
MLKPGFVLLSLLFLLAACARAPELPPTPRASATVIPATEPPAPTSTPVPGATATATQVIDGNLFSKITHSTAVLHLECDPLEIIFDVTIKEPNVKGVSFFFRMKDKATGFVSEWSNGEDMRSASNGIFEFIFRASAIPTETTYKEAWVQYQLVGINQTGQTIGQSQVFSEEITFTPTCP